MKLLEWSIEAWKGQVDLHSINSINIINLININIG